jgi:hypothetical protein
MSATKKDDGGTARGLTRREMLTGGAAAAAGAIVASIAPQTAMATTGETIVVDGTYQGVFGTTVKAQGKSYEDPAVCGTLAFSDIYESYGVLGIANDPVSLQAAGVCGRTGVPQSAAVWAQAQAQGATALVADADAGGTAVRATAPADGTALDVNGVATFSRSGKGKIPKGKSYIHVTVAGGLATSALVLVTLQNTASGTYLSYATRISSTSFTAVLNKAATSDIYFAWFIVG